MWEASRHNAWSGYVAVVLNVTTVVLIALTFIRARWLRWTLNLVAVLACMIFAIEVSSYEIEEKWRIRFEYVERNRDALTEGQRRASTADGANRVLGPILIGGYDAIVRCSVVLFLLGVTRFVRAKAILKRRRPVPDTVRQIFPANVTPSNDPNPYSPPPMTSTTVKSNDH